MGLAKKPLEPSCWKDRSWIMHKMAVFPEAFPFKQTNTMDHLGSNMGASIYVLIYVLCGFFSFARICSLKYRFALWQSKSLILIPTIHAARETQQTYPCMVSELFGWIFDASSLRKNKIKSIQPKNSDELGETFKTPPSLLGKSCSVCLEKTTCSFHFNHFLPPRWACHSLK